jgi:hypothetical protein
MESERLNLWGLKLTPTVTNQLRKLAIHARPQLSLEHQGRARRYVVRGVESGGAVEEIGYYVSFAGEHGQILPWLQTLDWLTVNGTHAVILAPVLTRIEMLRIGRTYDLCITKHKPLSLEPGKRPKLHAEEIFRGECGYLPLELWGKEKELRGFVKPQFFTRSGEEIPTPEEFEGAVKAVTAGVACAGCSHPHYSRPATEQDERVASSEVLVDLNDGLLNGNGSTRGERVAVPSVAAAIPLEECGELADALSVEQRGAAPENHASGEEVSQ